MLRRALTLAAVLCLSGTTANGHPHGWIDLESTLLVDADGQVTGLRLGWSFDPVYTAFVLDGVKPERVAQADLDALASENLGNLEAYDYFTEIEYDGHRQPLGPVREFQTALKGDQLWLQFEVPLAQPVALRGHDLHYAVYDPTYYIEIRHGSARSATVAGPGNCTARLIEPQPPLAAIALASGLDRTQSGGDGLGRMFAEWVTVTCPESTP